MYCISIGIKDFELALKIASEYEMAEIRLDLTDFNTEQIIEFCHNHPSLIFTCRQKEGVSTEKRLILLSVAIDHQASWIDLDIDEEPLLLEEITHKIQLQKQTKLIISYHNYSNCPTNDRLFNFLYQAMKYDPAIIKMACYSHGIRDNKRILRFNQDFSNVLAFCMGEKGRSTRPLSLLMGAPFAYVSIPDCTTAPGQMTRQEMDKMIGDFPVS